MSSQSNGDVKWLWELNETQKDYYRANLSGTRIISFVVTFNCSKPVTVDDFWEAIRHFQRKIPHLRTCVRCRGDSLWFCQPADIKPNFQLVEGVRNMKDLVNDMVRNIMLNPDTISWDARVVSQKDDAVCEVPEVKVTHPYQYNFLFTSLHSLMDGLGIAYVTRSFLETLVNTMSGIAVDDEQYVSFYDDKEIPTLLSHSTERLIEDADFSETVKNTLSLPNFIPLIFQAFPRPNPAVATTKSVTGVIEPTLFSDFKLRCKGEGITLNSFIVAAINIAIMELARGKGIITDSYTISPCLMTSYRRYLKSPELFLGPCSGGLSFKSVVDVNTVSNFWTYCRTLNDYISSNIEEGLPLHQKALGMLSGKESYNYTSNLRPILNDYVLSNLGDMTSLAPKSDLLIVTDFKSMTNIHNSFQSSLHDVMTFNGRLYYTLSYPTNCFSDETAQLFLDQIFSTIKFVTNKSKL